MSRNIATKCQSTLRNTALYTAEDCLTLKISQLTDPVSYAENVQKFVEQDLFQS